jgi:hypothetical protein
MVSHKYEVGNRVKIKDSFPPTASSELHELAGSTVKILCKAYIAGPYYEITDHDALIPESAIECEI